MSLFARFERAAAAAQTALYGETWMLHPRARGADPNGGSAADPDRAERAFVGVYRDAPEEYAPANTYDPRTVQRPGLIGGTPTIEIDPRHQDTALDPLVVREGDHVTRADGVTYRLGSAETDAMGRVVYPLNRMRT